MLAAGILVRSGLDIACGGRTGISHGQIEVVCKVTVRLLSEIDLRRQASGGDDMRNAPFKVRPIAGALGAELIGDRPVDGAAGCDHRRDPSGVARPPGDLLPRSEPAARAFSGAGALLWRLRSNIRSSRASRVSPRSSTSPSSSTRRSISAAYGTPTRPICRSRRWRRCWSRAKSPRPAATRCSPTSTSPSRLFGETARTARRPSRDFQLGKG